MSSLKSGSSGCIGLPCLCSKLAMYACNSFDGSGCMGMALIMLPVDPFGPSEVRRVERALIEEYRAMVLRALEMPSLHDAAVGDRRATRSGARLRGHQAAQRAA